MGHGHATSGLMVPRTSTSIIVSAVARASRQVIHSSDSLARCSETTPWSPHHYHVMFMTRTPAHDHHGIEKNNPEEDAYGFLVQTVADGIAAGRFRPEFTDAHELAQIHWCGLHGVVSLHLAKEGDEWITWRDAATTAGKMIEVLIRGTIREEEG